jgi:REP element-mobilizing transposase RayT
MRADYAGRCNRTCMHGHFWIPSYFAVSAAGTPLSIIKRYMENQARVTDRPTRHLLHLGATVTFEG